MVPQWYRNEFLISPATVNRIDQAPILAGEWMLYERKLRICFNNILLNGGSTTRFRFFFFFFRYIKCSFHIVCLVSLFNICRGICVEVYGGLCI